MFRSEQKNVETENKSENKKWTCVFFFNDWEEDAVAKWVKELNQKSGQDVRYKRFLGATHIDGSGDLDKIRQTIKSMIPELNKTLYEREVAYFLKNGGKKGDIENLKKRKFVKEADVDYWTNLQTQESEQDICSKPSKS